MVLKADVPGLLHKADAGAVELDLRTEAEVRAAYRRLADRFGERQRQVLVQPMIAGGTEVIIGVTDDHMFGPLVVFGLGGVATEVLADHAARLTPLTDTDADQLIGSIRSARLLRGYRGRWPGADHPRATRPTSVPCATCCSACRGWPTTCPRSPNSTSTRSSPGRTGSSWSMRGSR